MQLKRLEAYGFKSFAERIVVQFDQGITAVVGPNGSGKSNITDAVRWVLGEQNIRMLRGLRSEDIIFAGSAARRALSVAEVVLVFDNTDKKLPIDYDEVVVKRRLYRNGDSEVYLNDSRCRIKDIYQLFADTGIGHDGMSIIGQNRLNDILDSRPEERRVFFEETAGITKYRARKQEALRKLRENEGDLVRLNDIMYAQAAELEPLAMQSEKTMRFRQLDAERRKYQLTSLVQQHDRLLQEQDGLMQTLNEHRDEEAREMRARREAEEKKNALEADIALIDGRMQENTRKLRRQQEKLDVLRQEESHIKGRQDQGSKRKTDVEGMRQSAVAKKQATEQEIAQIDAILAQQNAAIQEKKAEQTDVQQEIARVQAVLSNEERTMAQHASSRTAVQRVLARLRERLAVARNAAEQGDESKERRQQEIERRRTALAEAQTECERKNHTLAQSEKNLQSISQEQRRLYEDIEKLRSVIEHGEAQLRKSDAELLRLRQNLDFQRRIQDSYEGFGRDVQTVLQATEGWRRGIAGTVADLISIPERYLTAIDVALGGSVRNVVTEDTDTAKSAISYLKRKNGGRVTFLPLTTITVRPPREINLGRYHGVIGWANTLVQAEGKLQRVADHLLSQTLVMETLDDALIAAKQEGYRLRIVTLTGELLNPGGSLTGGGRKKERSTLLNRRTDIEALHSRLKEQEAAHQKLHSSLEQQIQLFKEKSEQSATQRAAAERLAQELMELRGKCDILKERIADQANALHEMERAEEERLASGAKLMQIQMRMERHISCCEAHEERFAQAAEQSGHRCVELRNEQQGYEECLHGLDVSIAALSAEIETRTRNRKSRTFDLAEAERTLKDITTQDALLADELQRDKDRLAELTSEIERHDAVFQKRERRGEELKDQRLAHEAETRMLDSAIKSAVARIEDIRIKQHRCDNSLEGIRIRLGDCRGTLLSDFGRTPETAAAEIMQDADPDVLKERLRTLDAAIRALGAVNPNAVEEYAEKKARYEEEGKQIADLRAAKQDIEQIIQKIDQDMTRTFREAFRQIQEYFNDIFVRLFGGGIAELRLTDKDDILSSGVEILVTLPDKKRQNLSALSGGERALTVIALLFSFLQYRPSPFSILDEIDAPLDEANVSRFGEFLQEFAKHTQFIVVTHRKGTMRAADTMYGVTVEDAGVSKVLSIRLKDYEAEQPA